MAEKLIRLNTKKNQDIRELFRVNIPSLFARKFSGLPTY